jgi:hypothetical protein
VSSRVSFDKTERYPKYLLSTVTTLMPELFGGEVAPVLVEQPHNSQPIVFPIGNTIDGGVSRSPPPRGFRRLGANE